MNNLNYGKKEERLYETSPQKIMCPSCHNSYTELEWDHKTAEVVRELMDDNTPIIPYNNRKEGTFFRCPNNECEDEVITDKDRILRTQDEEGRPILWSQTDDLQWVKVFDENNYEIVNVSITPNSTYISQHRNVDLNEYSEKEMEEQIDGYYDSLDLLKETDGSNGTCHWKQIVAECIVEQSPFSYEDLTFNTDEELNEYLNLKFGILRTQDKEGRAVKVENVRYSFKNEFDDFTDYVFEGDFEKELLDKLGVEMLFIYVSVNNDGEIFSIYAYSPTEEEDYNYVFTEKTKNEINNILVELRDRARCQ